MDMTTGHPQETDSSRECEPRLDPGWARLKSGFPYGWQGPVI